MREHILLHPHCKTIARTCKRSIDRSIGSERYLRAWDIVALNTMLSPNESSTCRRRRRRSCHVGRLCAALLLSPSTSSAFAPVALAARKPTLVPRSAVVQRYRTENESSSAGPDRPEHELSDAFSFLPSRVSSIYRMDTPSEFQARVLDEEDALVVVRYYADACPSCRATGPLFRKWSRDIEASNSQSGVWGSPQAPLCVKIVEMPLTKATSAFLRDQGVEKLPSCHVYHPKFGLVEEQLVMSRADFEEFVNTVDCWSKGGCETDLGNDGVVEEEIEFEMQGDGDCEEFC